MHEQEPIWGPILRAGRAAIAFLGHFIIGMVLIVGIWATERMILWLWEGRDPQLYGRIPLKYLFDTLDLAVFSVFIVWGTIEAHRKLKG
jgi:hypothetical protein